jgi:hypothetical protein
VGELVGNRRCFVCCTDDVALEGWVSVGVHLVCADCSRAALGGALPYGQLNAAYRGRVGSPRRSLGEVYRRVVDFKERRGDWMSHAVPLAASLAASAYQLWRDRESAGSSARWLLVPVPSFRNRRRHMRLLTALASVRLPQIAIDLDALFKTRDIAQKGLSRAERVAAGRDAYVLGRGGSRHVSGRHVIVADDLVTTGVTLEACARALLAAGAAAVDGVAVVRVLRAPPERVVPCGARQVRLQLRELDGRGRARVAPEPGSLWVHFGCSPRCPVTAAAGPYALPTLDAVAYHRWMCRCGASHLIRIRREWRGGLHECVAIGVGERRPSDVLVGVLQGPPAYV